MERRNFTIVMVLAILALLFVVKCQNDSMVKLKVEKEILVKELNQGKKEAKEMEKVRLAQKDSISKENERLLEKNKVLQEKEKQSKRREAKLREQLREEKEKIKNMSYQQVADTLNIIYNTKAVTATDSSVNMGEDIPNRVLSDVVEKENLVKVVAEKEIQNQTKDAEISNLEEISRGQGMMLISAEEQLEKERENLELAEKLNKNLEKQVKRPRVGQILIGVAVGVIGGVLLAN